MSVAVVTAESIIITLDGLITVRTHRNDLDGTLQFFLKEGNIVVELLGEFLLRSHLGHIALPAGKLCVDGLYLALNGIGELLGLYAIDALSHASLDGLEGVELVALHHDEVRDTINHN